MSNNALIVFTAKSTELILGQSGTSSWVLSPTSMRDVRYVVCTRNTGRELEEGDVPRTEAHGEAFLVGKVAGLKQVELKNDRKRYLVQMSEYARVSVPDFWTHDRNPTRYTDTGTLLEWGIDVDKLDWLPMPETGSVVASMQQAEDETTLTSEGLTIAEAKYGLSLKFGVPEEAVQITING